MRCPTVNELPVPPAGRTGWPWTEETPQAPDTVPDGHPWPRFSIVTPSLNQGEFIEETIRSVLLQGYPNLEYIIIDGGSTDNSVEIIKKYEPWLAYWVSEPDRGQAHAINKGFGKSSGEMLGWLNADDCLLPASLTKVAEVAEVHLSAGAFVGGVYLRDSDGIFREAHPRGLNYDDLIDWSSNGFCQPSCFFRRWAWETCGPLDESLDLVFDFGLWLKISRRHPFMRVPEVLSTALWHAGAKTARTSHMVMDVGILQMRYGREDLALKTLRQFTDKWDALHPLPWGLYADRYSQAYRLVIGLKKIPMLGNLLKGLGRELRRRKRRAFSPDWRTRIEVGVRGMKGVSSGSPGYRSSS